MIAKEYFGVYGYTFTKAFRCGDFAFDPVYQNLSEVRKKASDDHVFHLTGILEANGAPGLGQRLHDLEAILSLIDHRNVIIRGTSKDRDTVQSRFPKEIVLYARPNGGGKLLIEDAFFPESRRQFIELTTNVLSMPGSGAEAFAKCLHKCAAWFRLPTPFVDVTYYLLFSGLEGMARAAEADFGNNAAVPITRFLQKYGFDVAQDDFSNELRSITNYCHVRNALFHNGEYEKNICENGVNKTLKLSRFLGRLRSIVPLSILKYVGFDDGHINWNRWRDRIPFK